MIFVKRNLPNLEVSVAKKKKKKMIQIFQKSGGEKKGLTTLLL